VVSQGKHVRLAPVALPDSAALRMNRLYPGTLIKPAVRQVLVTAPTTARIGGKPVEGIEMLDWVREVLRAAALTPVG
jgi:transcription-repair coupling factor (superfamily II helicase)